MRFRFILYSSTLELDTAYLSNKDFLNLLQLEEKNTAIAFQNECVKIKIAPGSLLPVCGPRPQRVLRWPQALSVSLNSP